FLIVGSEGMLSYDDADPTEKIKLYDRGISLQDLSEPMSAAAYTARISYRSGDLFSPAIANTEALQFEISEFKRAIHDQSVRQFYTKINRDVMQGLDAINHSLEQKKPRGD